MLTKTNPWLEIPYTDYENHMSDAGQAQMLNKLTKYCLKFLKPSRFALFGCATGNGLEHVDTSVTKEVIAIDLNPGYLTVLNQRFGGSLPNLKTVCADIEQDNLPLADVDPALCGLVFEYVNPEVVIGKIVSCLSPEGKIAVVLQHSEETSFVSKSPYTSLESLASFAREIDEKQMVALCQSFGMKQIYHSVFRYPEYKPFLVFIFSR